MALLRINTDKLWDITLSTLLNMVRLATLLHHYKVHNPLQLTTMRNSNNSHNKMCRDLVSNLKLKLQTPSILPHPHNHSNNTIQVPTIRTNSEVLHKFRAPPLSKPATLCTSLTQIQQLLLINNKGNLITMDKTNSTNSRDRLNLLQLSNLHKSSSNNNSGQSSHLTPLPNLSYNNSHSTISNLLPSSSER